ncbi:hypothetical protein BX070DRAFT_221299 [Coemansia spiralis]|nr:hypothetical protein BX070DRAFT_221299 [Coemansia spiralis]
MRPRSCVSMMESLIMHVVAGRVMHATPICKPLGTYLPSSNAKTNLRQTQQSYSKQTGAEMPKTSVARVQMLLDSSNKQLEGLLAQQLLVLRCPGESTAAPTKCSS